MFKAILISLIVGAFATSYAEYRLNYNLYDLLKDKVLGFLSHIPFIGKYFSALVAIVGIAGLLTLGAHLSRAASMHTPPTVKLNPQQECCGLPPPCAPNCGKEQDQNSKKLPHRAGLIRQSYRHGVKPAAKASARAASKSAHAGASAGKKAGKGAGKAGKTAARIIF